MLDSPVHISIYSFPMGSFTLLTTRIPVYKKYQSSCLTSTTFWDAIPTYWFADADAINVICSDKFTYLKDVEAVRVVTLSVM